MRYIIRKVLTLIITLFMVSLLAFLAFQVIPGSPASSMLGTNATPEKIAALEAEMGLDDPVLVRYARWAGDFIQGDWGCWPLPSLWPPPSPWASPPPGGRGAY